MPFCRTSFDKHMSPSVLHLALLLLLLMSTSVFDVFYGFCTWIMLRMLRTGSPTQPLLLIRTRCLRFLWHVARTGDSQDTYRALYTSILGLPKDWKRRPGHPRHTWIKTIEADLQPLNHSLNLARQFTEHGKMVEAARGEGYTPVWGMPTMKMVSEDWRSSTKSDTDTTALPLLLSLAIERSLHCQHGTLCLYALSAL